MLYTFVRDNVIMIVEDPALAVKKHAQGWKLVKVDVLLDVWRTRDTADYARLTEEARREQGCTCGCLSAPLTTVVIGRRRVEP